MKTEEKQMATRRQIRAFRKNAKHSTGPRTPEGKARSSQNARKHGLFARDTVLPEENPEEFIQLIADLEEELEAGGAFERRLVRHIADAEWRMRRLVRLETGALMDQLEKERLYAQRVQAELGKVNQQAGHGEENATRPADPYRQSTQELGAVVTGNRDNPVLLTLSLYESRLSRKYFSLLKQLRFTQKPRRATEPEETEARPPAIESPRAPQPPTPATNQLGPQAPLKEPAQAPQAATPSTEPTSSGAPRIVPSQGPDPPTPSSDPASPQEAGEGQAENPASRVA